MLGKWLHGDGAAKFADNAFFNICRHEHAEFHQEAGQVAIAISEGRFDDADAMLNYGSSYSIASSRVNAAIIGLKRDIALAA
jgi:hypothetical protein